MTYWDILNILTIIEFILAFILLLQVAKLFKKPIGLRLVILSAIFIIQGILGIIIYNYWRSLGFGATLSIPLIMLQLTIVAGTLILIDITRW